MLTVGTFHLPSVILSVFSWSSFYFTLRHLEPQRKAEWHCRMVTAVHAALISVITAWACFVQGPWPFTDAGGPNTPLQITASTICLGYFLFDFAWCLYFQTEGIAMLMHHSLSVLGMSWILLAGKYGTELVATICGSEVTNPLLQLRWFLKETGRYHTVLGEVVDVSFMLSFFFVRIVVGSVLLYSYFLQPTDYVGRFGALAIYLISWVFWVSIFQYAVYKYGKMYRAWQCRKQAASSSSNAPLLDGDSQHSQSLRGDQCDNKMKDSEENASVRESSSDSVASEGQELSPDVSKNGVHCRSNGVHAHSNGTLTVNGTMTDNDLPNSVLANGKKIV